MKTLKRILALGVILYGLQGITQDPHADSGLKKVVVKEVIQVNSYTYLHVLEEGDEKWIAVPTMEAQPDEVYYYQGGAEMRNFFSTELNRTFDVVLFLGGITNANAVDPVNGVVDPNAPKKGMKPAKEPTLDQLALDIDSIEGGVRIETLFEKAQQYAGKQVKVVGEVTKFTPNIMGKNWIHFQDGTAFEGNYDLMVTSQEQVAVGDIVIFEGVIAVDKNFGAGYFYKVILEDGVIVN
jgi:hypothetical protein